MGTSIVAVVISALTNKLSINIRTTPHPQNQESGYLESPMCDPAKIRTQSGHFSKIINMWSCSQSAISIKYGKKIIIALHVTDFRGHVLQTIEHYLKLVSSLSSSPSLYSWTLWFQKIEQNYRFKKYVYKIINTIHFIS